MHAEPQTWPEQVTAAPGNDSNTDPTPPLPVDTGRNAGKRDPSGSKGRTARLMSEEQEFNHHERDMTLDSRDREGMIRDLDNPAVDLEDNPKGHGHGH
ncbi:hypothetical protein [Polaromonas sp.]|uniref:hypothetical protein n=1 Tax=Polaromonas sp. TaxID=1869339 RepID=UPI0027316D9B|nr:hypothetical protein [Polaromonas sp.]MDP1740334.1 hypothetical protein [Polaromonas sp.]